MKPILFLVLDIGKTRQICFGLIHPLEGWNLYPPWINLSVFEAMFIFSMKKVFTPCSGISLMQDWTSMN